MKVKIPTCKTGTWDQPLNLFDQAISRIYQPFKGEIDEYEQHAASSNCFTGAVARGTEKLLADEKEQTKHYDRVNAQRRRLPMVKVEKEYVFNGPNGKPTLKDLFDGSLQLIVYHFMFDPKWDKGCPGCTGFVDALGDLSLLKKNDTTFVVISRAPLEKLEKYKAEKGWEHNWFSSFGSDFNYDFHVTLDPKVAPAEYNYRNKAEMAAAKGHPVLLEGEEHGLSVFFRLEDDLFQTDAYRLLDMTPYGRQQEFEDSRPGWPQHPTYA
jgi:predicted dithiol-disulfide oxidoreductase (DUF899 family)